MIWTDEEYQMIKMSFLGLAELHNFKLSELKVELYFKILQRFHPQDVVRAIELAIETTKFFPKPAELVELIMGTATDRAAIAWNIFLGVIRRLSPSDSVVFEDTRFSAIVDFFGGWDEVHKWKTEDLTWRRQEFIKLYASFRQPPPGHRHVGTIEHQNRVRGFLDYLPETVIVPKEGFPHDATPALPPPQDNKPLALPKSKLSIEDVRFAANNLFGGPREICNGY